MIGVKPLAIRIIGALGIVALLYWVSLAKGHAVGPSDSQQAAKDFNPSVDCPDTSLKNIDNINTRAIPAITKGIQGLPCDGATKAAAEETGTDFTDKLQHNFDYYSWLTFIALNSPADGKTLIGKDAPTIWETYKQLPDVMLPGGKKPSPWTDSNPPVVPTECSATFNPGMMIIHMEMDETYNEPFKSGPLFDQNGNYALFVILLNRPMFQYIADHSLYSRKGQEEFTRTEEINFTNGSDGSEKDHPEKTLGAIMIKASWRVVRPGFDYDPNNPKFHIIKGLLYLPRTPEPCRVVNLGLVGFHVGHKTVTRQQWIWTTFEHHDNVPTQQEVENGTAKGKHYSFYDPTCLSCPVNQTPPWPWDPEKLKPPWDPLHRPPDSFKSQIVRMGPSPIFADDDVGKLNKAFHNWERLRGTVWENYDLITTQWPSGFPCASNPDPGSLPDATCAPFPTFLANTTLETFSQQEQGAGVPLATSSCISCHNNATTNPTHDHADSRAKRSDFTYILEKAH